MTTASSVPTGDLASQILQKLAQQSPIVSSEAFPSTPAQDVKAALDRLGSRSMITYETQTREEIVLEPEAEQIIEHGSHESRVFEALRQAVEGLTVQELQQAIGDKNVVSAGQKVGFKDKWIAKGKEGKLVATADSIEDTTRAQLMEIKKTRTAEPKQAGELKKRKLLKMHKVIS